MNLIKFHMTFAFLLVLLNLNVHAKTSVPAGPESFVCGEYVVTGRFLLTKEAFSVIRMYPGSSREYEIMLGKVPTKLERKNDRLDVRIRIRITRKSTGTGTKADLIRFEGPAKLDEMTKNPVKLIRKISCSRK